MELTLDLINDTEHTLPEETEFKRWIETALKMAEYDKPSDVAIRFVENEEIQTLNREYRDKDKPTNVLSFPFEVPEFIDEHIPTLGDIIIAMDVIIKEAAEQEKTVNAHLTHMTVHGTLHLLGFDHITDEEAEEMEGLEIQILAELGLPNPYLER